MHTELVVNIFYDETKKSTMLKLVRPLDFKFKNINYSIERGFVSDGGSIPRAFWRILTPLDGRYIKIFVIHDWMYSTNVVSRKDADIFLRDSLKYAGMSCLLYETCYNSVRLFRK